MKQTVMIARALLLGAVMGTFVAGGQAFAGGHGAHWGYEGHAGPAHWGDLDKKYITCKTGKKQSPIDISGASHAKMKNIRFNYRSSKLAIVNNGHTIQVNIDKGSSTTIRGQKYRLLQFHFHGPSEHLVNGKPAPMEAHLVHINGKGQLAVVGVMMKKGKHNRFIAKIWKHMPSHHGMTTRVKGKINAQGLLPRKRTYYHYSGSLTTPPCSEGVNWNVMTTAIEVSPKQIAAFKKLFKHNARPAQPLNGRKITSNSKH